VYAKPQLLKVFMHLLWYAARRLVMYVYISIKIEALEHRATFTKEFVAYVASARHEMFFINQKQFSM